MESSNPIEEKLLKDIINTSVSEELARQLIKESRDIIEVYYKAQVELLKSSIANVSNRIDGLLELSKENRNQLLGLIGNFIIDEIILILLVNAADAAVLYKIRMSNFIYQAAQIFEASAIRNTIGFLSSKITDSLLKAVVDARPEPSKENLS